MSAAEAPHVAAQVVDRQRDDGRVVRALIALATAPPLRYWSGQWSLPSRQQAVKADRDLPRLRARRITILVPYHRGHPSQLTSS